jgi:hypothetical protein
MRIINVLAAVIAVSLAGGAAVAGEKTDAPKGKKICQVVQPAIGRIPERRVCTVKAEGGAVAVKGKASDASGAAASGGRD